ncbi:MAG: hypothetical protein JF589_09155 [Gemmatimonadetes bacterium]|jgi:hypothetical protein|nr:hypothetical protein [Gemmatimonadota bacterium]
MTEMMPSSNEASARPALTVVSITPDRYETVRRTLRHVRAQTARDQIELLLIVPARDTLEPDESELAEFRWVKIVEVGALGATGEVRARAVREASAPIVVFTEDHCFPEPEWAAALLARHAEPWAAVGPVLRNANPETMVSWADLFIGYGPWLAPGVPGPKDHLPGHNSSYKVSVLLEYGDQLAQLMEAESVLHWDLRRRGYQLYLEPAARAAHTNFEHWTTFRPVQVMNGRAFADTRRRDWPASKRLVFAAASPLIPFVRFVRAVRDAHRAGIPVSLLARVAPALAGGLFLDGVGQMLGYAFGADDSLRVDLVCFESHRVERNEREGAQRAHV